MELIGIISSVVAAIAALATLWFSVRTGKGSILQRIDKKELRIRRINDKLVIFFSCFFAFNVLSLRNLWLIRV